MVPGTPRRGRCKQRARVCRRSSSSSPGSGPRRGSGAASRHHHASRRFLSVLGASPSRWPLPFSVPLALSPLRVSECVLFPLSPLMRSALHQRKACAGERRARWWGPPEPRRRRVPGTLQTLDPRRKSAPRERSTRRVFLTKPRFSAGICPSHEQVRETHKATMVIR